MNRKTLGMFSVIIPAFNEQAVLGRLLDALAHSTFRDLEVIVVSDASTDATEELAQRAGVRLLRHSEQRGPAAARNTGAAASHGRFLLFLDADVVPDRECLGRLAELLDLHPEIRCFSGVYASQPVSDGWFQRYRALLSHHYIRDLPSCAPSSLFVTAAAGIERRLFEELGGFDPTARAKHAEDTELGYRIALHTSIYLLRSLAVRHDFPPFIRTFRNYYQRSAAWFRLFQHRRRFDNHTTTWRIALLRVVSGTVLLGSLLPLVIPGAMPLVITLHASYLLANRRFFWLLARKAPLLELPLMYVADLFLGVAVLAGALTGAIAVFSSMVRSDARSRSSAQT